MRFYRWDEVEEREVGDGVTRRIVHGERLMVIKYSMRKGSAVALHRHDDEQIACVLSGVVRFRMGDEARVMRAGELVVVPPNVEHGAEPLEDTVDLDVFTPIREEWLEKG